ncbi:hypothetical protein HS088_TW20G00146 [Tripterygium wilfordii]|uniref:Uncharacterized protein n=1 Tax=Tripterygium wilfordii TaxID=458696 RepID=A0A7J7C6P9_TRIWF|nr:uncharacterized protein LOC119987100 [Tripterygium wilfordii]KAF5729782.1 hypothetical protein HS088_TW20G00146 [Tripterygium wilfordii]
MCMSTDFHGFNPRDRSHLRIKAFFIKLSGFRPKNPIPESLTLVYLPRISGSELEIEGSKIRPDSTAFVTLHRVVNQKTRNGEAIYGNRERVRAGDGIRFEVYLREEKVLKGVFRRVEEDEWRMECTCGLEREISDVAAAEACVAVEGKSAMRERVEMAVKRKRKCSNQRGFLEDIPEGREIDDESDGQCCCCSFGDGKTDGGDSKEKVDLDLDMEGVRWAVDVGIWVVSLGVGYLVSKASAKSLRRMRLL